MNYSSSTCSSNKVTFGPQPCEVLDCTRSWIKCKASNAYLTHYINNSASDPCNKFKLNCLIFQIRII